MSSFRPAMTLLLIPIELIDRILCNLDLRSLLKCQEVCKQLKHRIDNSKEIQYIMELEISGLEANVYNTWASAESLKRLHQYQSAWERLEWKSEKKVPMKGGRIWELYGGVLAQTDKDGVFHFLRLASSIRDITERSWELTPDVEQIRDFSMDPSQDLLVWITAPTRASPLSLHLRTLSTAEKHPLARHGIIQVQYDERPLDGRWHFSIKIMKNYIGLRVYQRLTEDFDGSQDPVDVYIWDWKEDKLELDISTKYTQSFAFLSDSHVILADRSYSIDLDQAEGYLTLIDFRADDGSKKPLSKVQNSLKLCYPAIADGADLFAFNIASEPTPGWTPGRDDQTPFFIAKENRIFTVSIILVRQTSELAFDHFIPLSAFKKYIDPFYTSTRQALKWSDWAPTETRLVRTGSPSSSIYPCFAHGSRSIVGGIRRRGEHLFFYTCVYDFNQLAFRREMAMGTELRENCVRVNDPQRLPSDIVWREAVETSLPYKRHLKRLDVPPAPHSLMCTADHIVLVDPDERWYRIYALD